MTPSRTSWRPWRHGVFLLFALAGCGATRADVLSLGGAGTGGLAGAGPAGAGAAGAGAAGVSGVSGTLLYISPDGDDLNPGTETAPLKTFVHAMSLLGPGSTLVLEDGTYAGATTGYLRAFCGLNAPNGTADKPVTVRAQNERSAFLKGEGAGAPIELSGCSNWILEGLRAEGADVLGEKGDEAGSVVVITHGCTNVVLRRLLAAHPNRYLQATVFVIAHAASNILVEECEALDYHYYGFHAFDVQHMTFRRSYAHSRDVPDIMGAVMPTTYVTTGDGGFLLTKSSNAIIENCIAEDVADGFTIAGSENDTGGKVQPQGDRILGSIAADVTHAGFLLESRCKMTKPCNQGDLIVSDPRLSNDVVRRAPFGVLSEGGVSIQIENVSIFDVTDTGIVFDRDALNMGLTSSAFARSSIVTTAASTYGFRAMNQFDWSFSRCNAFGPTTTFAPRDGRVISSTEIDPQMGGCYVVVPDASPLKNAAQGAGIGANIMFRTEDGQLTTTKLWDQTTGQFPCGATVAGVNDTTRTDVSCLGVATRLHVGAAGCAIP